MIRTLIMTVFLLFLSNTAAGQEESVGQYGPLQMIASEISESYTAIQLDIVFTRQPTPFDYISSAELIEQHGKFPEPLLQPQAFEADPSDLESITGRRVYIFGQPMKFYFDDDDTFLNLKIVNGATN